MASSPQKPAASSKDTPAAIEIHFVTGKGGVGKSTVAAALALAKAREGKRTLLVELGTQSFYQDFLSISPQQVTYKPLNLVNKSAVHLDVALWSGPECLHEYALHLLRLESLYRLFFENPVSRALLNVAPALPELAIMGKITSGPPRFVGPALPYDVIVVDAFSTGHFLALMRAPTGMAEAIRFGPMGEQSRRISEVLKDRNICRYHVVTLPEEMPVEESLELIATLKSEFQVEPDVIINKIFPLSQGGGSPAFEEILNEMKQKSDLAMANLSNNPLIKLPFIFEIKAWSLMESLAEILAKTLNKGRSI